MANLKNFGSQILEGMANKDLDINYKVKSIAATLLNV